MIEIPATFGSKSLDEIVKRLKGTSDPRRRYEYVLWLAKNLPEMPLKLRQEKFKVKGCVSVVYVYGELINGKLFWQGYSDALITKGLLALVIKGLNELTPDEIASVDSSFIEATGLSGSLTPSRANGFLNIFLNMKGQAKALSSEIS